MNNLAEARVGTVSDHVAFECDCDWNAVIVTYADPRYEVYGNGPVSRVLQIAP
jgi:hypothetical protein